MDQDQEPEIIKRVLAGERREYALLIDAYKRPIFNLAYRMTGSYADADDLTQETFILAYQKLEHFHLQKKFFSWLYTISLNLIRTHLKKRTKDPVFYSHNLVPLVLPVPDQTGEQNTQEYIKRVETGMMKLPVDLREIIIMKFHSDLTFEEIASITDLSVSAVKMRVYRGLEKLKSWIVNENKL